MAWETRILVTTNSQNVSNNTSNVTFTFQARRTDYSVGSWNNYGTAYWQIAAGGKSSGDVHFNFSWNYGQNVWFTIASWTTTITHNADGTYSSTAQAYVVTQISIGTLSCSQNYTLATIPRESTISSITGDTIGSNITVNISRQSSSFTHQVWWRINGTGNWTSLGTNFGTSCTFTLPMSVCNSVTQSTTCTLNIAIRAISNGSYVGGEVWSSKTVNVPSSVVPSFSSIGVSEAVSSVASLGIYVQSKSKLNLSINGASGSYGSWITAYSISVDGQNIYAASGTTNVINGSGNLTITARITDSRGRTASKTTTINVKAYSAPRLTSYSATRQSTPTNVSVVASGSITSLLNGSTQKNSLTYIIKYKQSSASSYTSVTVKSGGLSFSNLSRTLTNIDSTKSYDIQLVLSDYFSSVTYQLKLSTTKVIMDLKSTGVGINKYNERGVLDVGGDAYISEDLIVEGGLTVGGENWIEKWGRKNWNMGVVNLNTLSDPGYYCWNSDVTFKQCANRPCDASGVLCVYRGQGFTWQTYQEYQGNNFYIRRYYDYEGKWSGWSRLTKESESPSLVSVSGWSEGWKFPNGLMIIRYWSQQTISTAGWGNIYEGQLTNVSQKSVPAGTFINNPIWILGETGYGVVGANGWMPELFEGSLTRAPSTWVTFGTGGTKKVSYCMIGIGRWK